MKNKSIGYQHPKYGEAKAYCDCMHVSEINAIITKYTARAEQTKQPEWYSKYVAIYFTYDGETYVLDSSDFKTSQEILELLSDEIKDELYLAGAYDMFCSGMLD